MEVTWSQFLQELESKQQTKAVVEFDGPGSFVKFQSELISVDRPGAFTPETMDQFGVIPYYVTLVFANGVHINLYMRHVEEVTRKGNGLHVVFKGEGNCKRNTIALDADSFRHGRAG